MSYKLLAIITGENNTQAELVKIDSGYSVRVRDLDSGLILPVINIYKTLKRAFEIAKTVKMN